MITVAHAIDARGSRHLTALLRCLTEVFQGIGNDELWATRNLVTTGRSRERCERGIKIVLYASEERASWYARACRFVDVYPSLIKRSIYWSFVPLNFCFSRHSDLPLWCRRRRICVKWIFMLLFLGSAPANPLLPFLRQAGEWQA